MGREVRFEALLWGLALGCFAVGYRWALPAAPGFELRTHAADEVRVVTWNVGGARGGETLALDDEQLEHVAERIRSLDADLVLLQEVRDRAQLRSLQRLIGQDWRREVSALGGDRRVAALAQRGTLESFDVDVSGDRALGVVFRPERWRDGEDPLVCLVLHAHAFSAAERNLQIGAARDALLARGSAYKVLAGDFNLDLDLGKRRDLFTDDEYRDVETYNYVTAELVDATRGSGSTAEPDRRLDYVFHSRELEARNAGPWRGQRAVAMDHHPVVVDFVRREAP